MANVVYFSLNALCHSSFFHRAVLIGACCALRTSNTWVQDCRQAIRLGWVSREGLLNSGASVVVSPSCWRTVPMSEECRKGRHAAHDDAAINFQDTRFDLAIRVFSNRLIDLRENEYRCRVPCDIRVKTKPCSEI